MGSRAEDDLDCRHLGNEEASPCTKSPGACAFHNLLTLTQQVASDMCHSAVMTKWVYGERM